MPESKTILDNFDAKMAKLERLYKLQLSIILMTGTAVLWGARLEWTSADHEKRVSKLEISTEGLKSDMIELKTRTRNVTSLTPKSIPEVLTSKLPQNNELSPNERDPLKRPNN